jgi:signal recognition particle GTPase|tara:strand:- start:1389 stop:1688 length:300 start_codon:yes stop_codon:yes gene_type:complete
MEINKNQIVNILNRLDDLEIEQQKNKEFFTMVKNRLLELNVCVNGILDIISYEDDTLYKNKMDQYENIKLLFIEELNKHEDKFDDDEWKQLMNQIIGEC